MAEEARRKGATPLLSYDSWLFYLIFHLYEPWVTQIGPAIGAFVAPASFICQLCPFSCAGPAEASAGAGVAAKQESTELGIMMFANILLVLGCVQLTVLNVAPKFEKRSRNMLLSSYMIILLIGDFIHLIVIERSACAIGMDAVVMGFQVYGNTALAFARALFAFRNRDGLVELWFPPKFAKGERLKKS